MTDATEPVQCVSCQQLTSGETARFWGGRCWPCEMQWLRTNKRRETVRGRPTVYTLEPWDTYRCIFIHIPKTAGMSVASALFGEGGATHAPLSSIQQLLTAAEFQTYFKFTFVRNPWDRLVSAYEFLRVGVGDEEYDKALSNQITGFGSFERFLGWIKETEGCAGIHFYPQHKYVNSEDSTNAMDFVGYFETLGRDVSLVANRLGLSVNLPHINATPSRTAYQDYYTPRSIDLVGEVYQEEIELFGYDFDNADLEANRLRYDTTG